jgi:hypothetical protein
MHLILNESEGYMRAAQAGIIDAEFVDVRENARPLSNHGTERGSPMPLLRTPAVRRFNETYLPRVSLVAAVLMTAWLWMVFWQDVVLGGFNVSRTWPFHIAAGIFWIYMTCQLIGAVFRPPQQIGWMILDILLSVAPLVVVLIATLAQNEVVVMNDYKYFVAWNAVFWSLTDAILCSWLMAKINFYADEAIVSESGIH